MKSIFYFHKEVSRLFLKIKFFFKQYSSKKCEDNYFSQSLPEHYCSARLSIYYGKIGQMQEQREPKRYKLEQT